MEAEAEAEAMGQNNTALNSNEYSYSFFLLCCWTLVNLAAAEANTEADDLNVLMMSCVYAAFLDVAAEEEAEVSCCSSSCLIRSSCYERISCRTWRKAAAEGAEVAAEWTEGIWGR